MRDLVTMVRRWLGAPPEITSPLNRAVEDEHQQVRERMNAQRLLLAQFEPPGRVGDLRLSARRAGERLSR